MKNLGFIGYDNYSVDVFGNVYSLYSNRFLSQKLHKTGYMEVSLYNEGESQTLKVHRLVAMCFCTPSKGRDVVNHRDSNRQNNFYKNLEWCTTQENNHHALKNNRKDTLHVEDVHKICKMIEQGFKNKEIKEILNLSTTTLVSHIRSKVTWLFISDEYNIKKVSRRHRIDVSTVYKICEKLELGWFTTTIAKEFNVGQSTVSRIKNKKTYSDISASYDF